MIDLSSFGLTSDFWVAMGGVFFVAIVAKFLRSETRTLLMAVVAVLLTSSPAACYVVGVLAMVFKLFDFVKVE